MSDLEIELMAIRLQTWLLSEFNEIASVMAIETAMRTVTEPEVEAEIIAYRTRYTLTDAGRAMLKGKE